MNGECVYCHGQALGMNFGELFPSRVVSAKVNKLKKSSHSTCVSRTATNMTVTLVEYNVWLKKNA